MCGGPLGPPTWPSGNGAQSADGLPASARLLQPEGSPSCETKKTGASSQSQALRQLRGKLSSISQYLLLSPVFAADHGHPAPRELPHEVHCRQSLGELSVQGGGKASTPRKGKGQPVGGESVRVPRSSPGRGSSRQHLGGAGLGRSLREEHPHSQKGALSSF